MFKLRHKVRKGHFYPMKVQISSISKLLFKLKFWFQFQSFKNVQLQSVLKNTRAICFWKLKPRNKKNHFKNLTSTLKIPLGPYLAVLPKTSIYDRMTGPISPLSKATSLCRRQKKACIGAILSICSRPGPSQRLLYRQLNDQDTKSITHSLFFCENIFLAPSRLTAVDSALSQIIDLVSNFRI